MLFFQNNFYFWDISTKLYFSNSLEPSDPKYMIDTKIFLYFDFYQNCLKKNETLIRDMELDRENTKSNYYLYT